MTQAIHRHRAFGPDELIGFVAQVGNAWKYETAKQSRDDVDAYPTQQAAEDALRDVVDQARGARIVAAAFIVALVTHPVLYAIQALA